MKDYNLIKYYAKITGAKPKRSKKYLICSFPYDDAAIHAFITFNNKTSSAVLFDLSDVYDRYASEKFSDYVEFLVAFTKKNALFKKSITDDDFVFCDLTQNVTEKVASQALMRVSVLIMYLNSFLGKKAEYLKEEQWRILHRRYLAKNKNISAVCEVASVAAIALDITALCLWGTFENPLLVLACLLLLPAAFLCFIIFAVRRRHFKSHLKKSINASRLA